MTGYDSGKVGTQTLTVTYEEEGFTGTYEVTVREKEDSGKKGGRKAHRGYGDRL